MKIIKLYVEIFALSLWQSLMSKQNLRIANRYVQFYTLTELPTSRIICVIYRSAYDLIVCIVAFKSLVNNKKFKNFLLSGA